MFTGIIETVGIILSLQPKNDVLVIKISAPKFAKELGLGDSVALAGVCSTVVTQDLSSFSVEIMKETLNCTNLKELKIGSRINLERAMRLDSRLDGHIVAGHVDGIAEVFNIENFGKTRKYTFSALPNILSEIVLKGSIAIDGVSLTISDIDQQSFSVGLIPTTLSETTITDLNKGDIVNIETDILGKYVINFLRAKTFNKDTVEEATDSLTWDKLNKYGWM